MNGLHYPFKFHQLKFDTLQGYIYDERMQHAELKKRSIHYN